MIDSNGVTGKYDLAYEAGEADEGVSVREILRKRLSVSTRLLRRLKYGEEAGVCRNDVPVRMNERVAVGDAITVRFPAEESGFAPEPIPIRVVYEDGDLLVIDKQAGLVVHPTKGHPAHTIANGLMHRMEACGERYKIRFVNRLDMDTTGLLVIGKNAYCQEDFARQAAENRVVKRYEAIVTGLVQADEGVIALPIGKAVEDELRRIVRADGFPSETRYRVAERFACGRGYTRLALTLRTGRTHQIRVHLAHIGHAVVGDALYGETSPLLTERQALHASELIFRHPRTKEDLHLTAPLPGDMEKLLEKLRATCDNTEGKTCAPKDENEVGITL
ncbi:MAG: RluA family pseudouridine synthase [Clostridiales Family XIII bacterium]|nr:RluA family pseudouridine synthase [Clostridiales Family XIII bacterium]